MPLIQCSFPHADPGEAHSFTRRNGWLELTLGTTRPETGLPYGVPARLLTIYCASEAVRTKSPEVYLGNSVHDFLRRLDVPITRGDRGSLRVYANQLLKLIHCTLTIDENIRDASGRTGLHIRQALFAEEARLWWDDETRGVGQGSSLVLSSVLFHSILDRSAPLSTNAIKQLRKSPMDLDVYAWLVHRLFNLSKPSTVTWQQLSEQFGHGYAELRKFRRFFIDSLKRVQTVYPEAQPQGRRRRRGAAAVETAPRTDHGRGHAPLDLGNDTRVAAVPHRACVTASSLRHVVNARDASASCLAADRPTILAGARRSATRPWGLALGVVPRDGPREDLRHTRAAKSPPVPRNVQRDRTRCFDAKPNDTRGLERSTQRRGVHPPPSAYTLAKPARFSAHPRRDHGSREPASRASTSAAQDLSVLLERTVTRQDAECEPAWTHSRRVRRSRYRKVPRRQPLQLFRLIRPQ